MYSQGVPFLFSAFVYICTYVNVLQFLIIITKFVMFVLVLQNRHICVIELTESS